MTLSWALLIDGDNISVRHADPLFDLVRHGGGVIATVRIYGDWQKMNGWRERAGPLGIVLRPVSPVSSMKNAADVALAVDAMNLMHGRFPTGFCIASSDSDFVPLALELKANGRRVIGAGMRPATEALRAAFDDWHQLDTGPECAAKCSARPAAQSVVKRAAPPRDPFVAAVIAAMDGADWIGLSQLGTALIRSGHHKKGDRLLIRLRALGLIDRDVAGRIEIARPL